MKGFDEYMNLVLDDAEEVHLKTKKRRPLGNNATRLYTSKKNTHKKMVLCRCIFIFIYCNTKVLFFNLVQNYIILST